MDFYLHDIPLEEAKRRFFEELKKFELDGALGIERVNVNETANGRVLAEPVWAKLSSPHYHAAAMDGFAVLAKKTNTALPSQPIQLKFRIDAAYVDTGDALPEWANSVIPIEEVESLNKSGKIASNPRRPYLIQIRNSVTPWMHVRPMGEDMVATQLVLPKGSILRPFDLGAIAASGNSKIQVYRQPRVGIIPTGSELKAIGKPVKGGEIIEFNSIILASLINDWGGQSKRYPITSDDFELICERVLLAARENDLVLLGAGSSAGSEDYSARVIEKLGRLIVHGVAIRPGHPVILGVIRKSKSTQGKNQFTPIIGVPGYPVSAALACELFVEPLISQWLGKTPRHTTELEAIMTRKITSPAGDDDFIRVVVGKVGERMLAAPLPRGAGVVSSLMKADGYTILRRGQQGVESGSRIKVHLYRNINELEGSIFAIGSHDMSLDILAQYLAQYERRMVSANVGSQGGLAAIRRGEAHIAGTHLLDPETGEYNIRYIREYLPDTRVRLMSWVGRDQGLMVKKGNPKKISNVDDLMRGDVVFINRQRGSGTRVLLDYHLKKLGIPSEKITGYEMEEYTHLGVAVAVQSNRADCGMGIAAAAKSLNLDFIPLYKERYDLIIPKIFLEDDLLTPLFELLKNEEFRQEISRMAGYDVLDMGKIIGDF
jgi:putative molybdopterin biosynthesis protein